MWGSRVTRHLLWQVREEKDREWFLLRFKGNLMAEPSQRPHLLFWGSPLIPLARKSYSCGAWLLLALISLNHPSAFSNTFLCKCVFGELSLSCVTFLWKENAGDGVQSQESLPELLGIFSGMVFCSRSFLLLGSFLRTGRWLWHIIFELELLPSSLESLC